ncbi:restriction endonuclease subunit S [Leuconostoc pseudomesenteroides]|uniref:restriction endonuclease subunit S n=1 Tax=Leuconostoc pseudomesenteroides TaxID=33968 RepID=UPI0021AA5B07|nr:restriction endonuclease subunit S [Leuconostoc pseudomesenteroides]
MSKKTPQIRFKGFTDDWEERKLGDVLSERNDQTPETNEYPLMSFVQGKGVTPKGERYNRSFLVKDSEKKYKKTELGDFIYSSNNLETGSIGFNRTGKAVISPVYSIFKSKKSRESQFIGIMSARKDFISKMVRFRQGVVYGQWRIHESDFLNIDMKMPNDKEQQLIISFFENIDKTIALHQRKLDLLKEQKKGFLQKLFPKNGAKIPELRFAGFADDWEERKLGDYVIIRSGWSPSNFDINNNANNLFIKVDDLNYSTRVQKESQVKVNILSKYKKMKKSSTIFPKRGAAIMTNKVRMLGEDSYMDTNMMALEPKGIDPEYLYTFINKTGLYKIADTSTIPQINNKHIEPYLLLIPSLEEQHKIGSFFKQLDETIALHQSKVDLLKEQKKGFLQKMFVS